MAAVTSAPTLTPHPQPTAGSRPAPGVPKAVRTAGAGQAPPLRARTTAIGATVTERGTGQWDRRLFSAAIPRHLPQRSTAPTERAW
ncbi:hypothetical protein GCM10009578_053010 [Streptomyces rhizosphaericus]|uniref:Uncharacterized protein n=1 Tax=Streptomyces rhizosphaericus TaxID=114699 RepID=A0ABN1QG81_9ACTN